MAGEIILHAHLPFEVPIKGTNKTTRILRIDTSAETLDKGLRDLGEDINYMVEKYNGR